MRRAFGDFQPGQTPIHAFDPRLKILCLIILCIISLFINNALILLCTLLITLLLIQYVGLPGQRIARVFIPLGIALSIIVIANAIRLDGTGDVAFGGVGFSLGGVDQGICVVCRVLAMTCAALVVSATTSIAAMTDALNDLMRPLDKVGLPTQDICMMLTLALRFIPVCSEQLERVRTAQMARGASFTGSNMVKRVLAWVPVFIPLMIELFNKAESLAAALRARCYGYVRVTKRVTKPSLTDLIICTVIVMIAIVLAVVW